jgi:hypothetical protein
MVGSLIKLMWQKTGDMDRWPTCQPNKNSIFQKRRKVNGTTMPVPSNSSGEIHQGEDLRRAPARAATAGRGRHSGAGCSGRARARARGRLWRGAAATGSAQAAAARHGGGDGDGSGHGRCGGMGKKVRIICFKKYLIFLIELTCGTQSTSANYATSVLESGSRY